MSSATLVNRVICSSPNSDSVWSNLVFVSVEDAELLPNGNLPTSSNYLELNGVVYKVVGDAKIDMHKIGLNAWQRTSADSDIGQTVSALAHVGVRVQDQLFSLEITVDLLKKKRTALEEKDIAKRFARVFAGQFFRVGQQVGARLGDNMVLFTINRALSFGTKSEGEDGKEGQVSLGADVKIGALCDKTTIEVSAADNRLLDFTAAKKRSGVIKRNWRFEDMGIGGLDAQFGEILRRAFASRLFPQEVIDQLGIRHVKGMLLYGPPGTGKTLIARQIGKMIDEDGPEPKVVNGPEVLNKFVGKSEENIRNLFKDAEEDYAENKENAQLHVIIFDEIDAICKQRGSNRGGTGVHDTIVNQILTKLDGVNSINNILVIGMTNRKDMIDSALLRPGRLEVHMEISLPDEKGRQQIFRIHTKTMRDNQRVAADVDIAELAARTKNYSGAEIEGLVKAATSSAMEPALDRTGGGVQVNQELAATLQVRMEDFLQAIEDCPPAFGVDDASLDQCLRGGFFDWGPQMSRFMKDCSAFSRQVETSERTNLLSVLLEGSNGCGKTAIAAKLALESKFPFVKLISPEDFVGDSEVGKSQRIAKIFDDALRSPLSLIILDNIERLLEYVPNGPRFSTTVLQTLLTLLKSAPKEEGKKLLIVSTTSKLNMFDQLDLRQAFDVIKHVPRLSKPEQVTRILESVDANVSPDDLKMIHQMTPLPIGVKQLLLVTEMAKQDAKYVTAEKFEQCLTACGLMGLDELLKGL